MLSDRQKELIKKLFFRGGCMQSTSDKYIRVYVNNPNEIHREIDITANIARSEKAIVECKELIEAMQAYQCALVERYNEIITAPTKTKVLLKRTINYYNHKIEYHILHYTVDLNTKHEELIQTDKYTGKERKQAITAFEQLQQEHKDWIFEKDIDKKAWEK